jgi:hypothetical protein
MAKVRILVFLSTLVVVGLVTLFVSYYARGYRFDSEAFFRQGKIRFEPNGILVIKSDPDGASVFLNGELKTATNATISLPPGTYDVEVRKDGFFTWSKRLVIEEEVVTNATASLFRNAPSLSPITFSGAVNPVVSKNGTKIAYVIPFSQENRQKAGLWTLDVLNLPLGFSNDPRRITDGDLTDAVYTFSPDERQILLTTETGTFLLETGNFTAQTQLINVASRKETILSTWKNEEEIRNEGDLRGLPHDIVDLLTRKTSAYAFSPDDLMILYTASSSATLPENLIKQLPGSSTQKQERSAIPGHTYIYDIKEDRNFEITDRKVTLTNPPLQENVIPAVRWLTSSRHILLSEENKITIMDYDGTNRQEIYSGSYVWPYAFPYVNTTKLLILTNLGASTSIPNLYTLTVK